MTTAGGVVSSATASTWICSLSHIDRLAAGNSERPGS